MRPSACLVFNPITVDNYASSLNCTPAGRVSDSMMAPTYLVGARAYCLLLDPPRSNWCFSFAPDFLTDVVCRHGISIAGKIIVSARLPLKNRKIARKHTQLAHAKYRLILKISMSLKRSFSSDE